MSRRPLRKCCCEGGHGSRPARAAAKAQLHRWRWWASTHALPVRPLRSRGQRGAGGQRVAGGAGEGRMRRRRPMSLRDPAVAGRRRRDDHGQPQHRRATTASGSRRAYGGSRPATAPPERVEHKLAAKLAAGREPRAPGHSPRASAEQSGLGQRFDPLPARIAEQVRTPDRPAP